MKVVDNVNKDEERLTGRPTDRSTMVFTTWIVWKV